MFLNIILIRLINRITISYYIYNQYKLIWENKCYYNIKFYNKV